MILRWTIVALPLIVAACPDPCVLGSNDCFIDSDCREEAFCSLDAGRADLCVLVPGQCIEGSRRTRRPSNNS
jgi:hypothetical protein